MDEEELSTKTPMEDVIDGEVIIAKAYDFFENELIDSETYNQRL
jgi:hypothetical protein